MRHCNSLTTLGHGEGARCGHQYGYNVYQCERCAKADLVELKAQLDASVRVLKIVAADPHRAWQIAEEIHATLKQIEGVN